jgi:hypothetical protein
MADDLTTGPEGEELQGVELVTQSDYEYMMGAINALEAIDQMDIAMLSQKHQRSARKAKRQSLDIIFHLVDLWHQELFDKDDEEDT